MKSPGPVQRVFTLSIDDFPVAAFVARNYAEARQLVHEGWLKEDLAAITLRGQPLWIVNATLSVRSADDHETKAYLEGAANSDQSDELVLIYLIPIDVVGPTT